ncbi:peroxiredoxin [Streptococcus bovimastitidis]|uniref:Peroxiredoxin n=1 Tax=Streptococcus bovimastitidis TaxID=1856638 RepID=A0A1L8MPJ5_9STRE|nr:OsmC family protein [Streptococcus bovimastitidis]OJF72667.1 peroxiredoxin [Streptococcus bovimastitidis]
MYQTEISGDYLYHTRSKGYGASVELFGVTEDGETPMSLLNIALASCVSMCIQSYFNLYHKISEMPLKVDATYENRAFTLNCFLENELATDEEEKVLKFVKSKCRVSQVLAEDVQIKINFLPL